MKKSSNLTKSGILTALSVVFLYLSLMMPTNRLSLLVLSSFMVPLAVITMSLRQAVLVYVSTALLALLIVGVQLFVLYALLFGPYGILKYLIEKLNNIFIEILLKLLYFSCIFGILYFFQNQILFDLSSFKSYLLVLWITSVLIFILYDFSLTVLINFFHKRIMKR